MLAFRSLARSVPRAVTQLTTRSVSRQPSILTRSSNYSKLSQLSPITRFAASFSSSARWRSDDQTLAIKLEEELKLEQDMGTGENSRAATQDQVFKAFLDKSGWEIQDVPGVEEIALVKKDGNETIRVVFSIADVNNETYPPDEAYEDEEFEEGEAAKDPQAAAEDAAEEPDYSESPTFSANLSVQVTNSTKPGAILLDAVTQDGRVVIESFWFLKDASMVSPKSFDVEKKRLDQYAGPNFSNLDEGLQEQIETYAANRGINEELATFIVDYIDWKEQREYVQWLENVKDFVSA